MAGDIVLTLSLIYVFRKSRTGIDRSVVLHCPSALAMSEWSSMTHMFNPNTPLFPLSRTDSMLETLIAYAIGTGAVNW